MKRRAILVHKDHPARLRARRKHARWGAHERRLSRRHRVRVEGCHGKAKTWHGLANMPIQACLTVAAINLKRLAATFIVLILASIHSRRRSIAHDRVLRGA